jgi:hypothetical protein
VAGSDEETLRRVASPLVVLTHERGSVGLGHHDPDKADGELKLMAECHAVCSV